MKYIVTVEMKDGSLCYGIVSCESGEGALNKVISHLHAMKMKQDLFLSYIAIPWHPAFFPIAEYGIERCSAMIIGRFGIRYVGTASEIGIEQLYNIIAHIDHNFEAVYLYYHA